MVYHRNCRNQTTEILWTKTDYNICIWQMCDCFIPFFKSSQLQMPKGYKWTRKVNIITAENYFFPCDQKLPRQNNEVQVAVHYFKNIIPEAVLHHQLPLLFFLSGAKQLIALGLGLQTVKVKITCFLSMWDCTNREFLTTVCSVDGEFLNQICLQEKYNWKILKYCSWTANQWCDRHGACLAITSTFK